MKASCDVVKIEKAVRTEPPTKIAQNYKTGTSPGVFVDGTSINLAYFFKSYCSHRTPEAALSVQTDIQKIYIAYFNRPADAGGLTYWQGQIVSGAASLADITTAFSTTAEYKALYASATPHSVVSAVYQNLFGRAPEAEGLKFWTDGMAGGRFSIGTVAYETLNGAQGSDKAIIDNKATASLAFTTHLEASNGDAGYSGKAIDKARDWLSMIDASPSSVTSAQTSIAQVVTSFTVPDAPPKTYTFTLGWDPTKPPPSGIDWSQMSTTPLEKFFPPKKIDQFTLGHDKIELVDISGNKISLTAPTWFYEHGEHTGGNGLNFQFSVYGALAYAHNGGKAKTLDALKAGETVLINTSDAAGHKRTYLFIDDGADAGTGGGMDNGVGSATWKLDGDVIIDITNLMGVRTNDDALTVAGSFFA